jgi:hypothetical protein
MSGEEIAGWGSGFGCAKPPATGWTTEGLNPPASGLTILGMRARLVESLASARARHGATGSTVSGGEEAHLAFPWDSLVASERG